MTAKPGGVWAFSETAVEYSPSHPGKMLAGILGVLS